MRKAINELGAAAARDRIARALGVERAAIGFLRKSDRVYRIMMARRGEKSRDLNPSEIQALAVAGVMVGEDGWEIEEGPAIKPGDLFRSKRSDKIRQADRRDASGTLPTWRLIWQNDAADIVWEEERDLLDPKRWERIAEVPASSSDAVALSPECAAIDDARMAGDADRLAALAERHLRERNSERALREIRDDEFARCAALRDALRCYGEAIVRPAFRGVAGLLRSASIHWQEGDGIRAALLALARTVDAGPDARPVWGYPDTLKLSRPEAAPRTTDGALTAYLIANYRDEWRTDDTAETLAIRLLGETQAIVDEAHREAEASDANAKEMAAELGEARAELNAANSRAAEAEHDRDEARAHLAKIRGAVRGIAAQLGVPHG